MLVLYSVKDGILLLNTVYKILIFLENPVRKDSGFQGCIILLICHNIQGDLNIHQQNWESWISQSEKLALHWDKVKCLFFSVSTGSVDGDNIITASEDSASVEWKAYTFNHIVIVYESV